MDGFRPYVFPQNWGVMTIAACHDELSQDSEVALLETLETSCNEAYGLGPKEIKYIRDNAPNDATIGDHWHFLATLHLWLPLWDASVDAIRAKRAAISRAAEYIPRCYSKYIMSLRELFYALVTNRRPSDYTMRDVTRYRNGLVGYVQRAVADAPFPRVRVPHSHVKERLTELGVKSPLSLVTYPPLAEQIRPLWKEPHAWHPAWIDGVNWSGTLCAVCCAQTSGREEQLEDKDIRAYYELKDGDVLCKACTIIITNDMRWLSGALGPLDDRSLGYAYPLANRKRSAEVSTGTCLHCGVHTVSMYNAWLVHHPDALAADEKRPTPDDMRNGYCLACGIYCRLHGHLPDVLCSMSGIANKTGHEADMADGKAPSQARDSPTDAQHDMLFFAALASRGHRAPAGCCTGHIRRAYWARTAAGAPLCDYHTAPARAHEPPPLLPWGSAHTAAGASAPTCVRCGAVHDFDAYRARHHTGEPLPRDRRYPLPKWAADRNAQPLCMACDTLSRRAAALWSDATGGRGGAYPVGWKPVGRPAADPFVYERLRRGKGCEGCAAPASPVWHLVGPTGAEWEALRAEGAAPNVRWARWCHWCYFARSSAVLPGPLAIGARRGRSDDAEADKDEFRRRLMYTAPQCTRCLSAILGSRAFHRRIEPVAGQSVQQAYDWLRTNDTVLCQLCIEGKLPDSTGKGKGRMGVRKRRKLVTELWEKDLREEDSFSSRRVIPGSTEPKLPLGRKTAIAGGIRKGVTGIVRKVRFDLPNSWSGVNVPVIKLKSPSIRVRNVSRW